MTAKYCHQCGDRLSDTARFCGRCGVAVGEKPAAGPADRDMTGEEIGALMDQMFGESSNEAANA